MQFASPTSLLWLLLALPLLALFLLRVKPRRVPIATVMFWQEAIPDSKPRRWWQRLRDPLMLVLQLVFLALLAFALAEPRLPEGFTPPQTWIVLIDTSTSMRAASDGVTRLQLAKQQVLRMIRGLRPEDRIALVAVNAQPSIIQGFSPPSRLLREALRQVRPSDGAADFDAASKLVDAMMPNEDRVRVICATDGSGMMSTSEAFRARAEWWVVGRPISNTAVTQFQVRRPWDDPLAVEALVELRHFPIEGGPSATSGTLRIELDNQLLDVVPWSSDGKTPWRTVQRYPDAPGGIVTLTASSDDTFHWDDVARAVLTPRTPRKIWLVGPTNVYLQGVLAALPRVEIELRAEVPERVPDDTVLIVFATDVTKLPRGKVMVIEPTALPAPWDISRTSTAEWIVPPEQSDALLSPEAFRDVLAQGVRRMQVPDNARVLLQAGVETPLYVQWRDVETEMLVLNVTLIDGDFVWRSLFPLLISRAIDSLTRGNERSIPATSAGQVATVPAAVWHGAPTTTVDPMKSDRAHVQLLAPNGETRPLLLDKNAIESNEPIVLGRLDQIGMWRAETPAVPPATESDAERADAGSSRSSVWLPCNLVNADESDLSVAAESTRPAPNATSSGHPIWYFLIVTALVVSAAEWWLYQRRWIG